MTNEMIEPVPIVFLLTFMLWVASIDIRQHRVPNVLVGALLISGLVFSSLGVGQQSLPGAFGGLIVGLLVFLPFYAMHGIGAADVKLLAAAGTFLGPLPIIAAGAVAMCTGALFASLLFSVAQLKRTVFQEPSTGEDGSSDVELVEVGKTPFPFVPFIAAGILVVVLYQIGVQV